MTTNTIHIFEYQGDRLKTYYNTNKRIEFKSIQEEIDTLPVKLDLCHQSISIINDNWSLTLKTRQQATKEYLDNHMNIASEFGKITQYSKYSLSTDKPLIMFVHGVPQEHEENKEDEIKYLREIHGIRVLERRVFANSRSSTIKVEVSNNERVYRLLTGSIDFNSTVCTGSPLLKHPELCVNCLEYGHLLTECKNDSIEQEGPRIYVLSKYTNTTMYTLH